MRLGNSGGGQSDWKPDPGGEDPPDSGHARVGKKKGNVPLDDAIMDLLNAGKISGDEAFDKAINKKRFRPYLSREPEPWEE